MEFNELSELIHNRCVDRGLCDKGKELWSGSSEDELLQMHLKEPEFFVINKPFPVEFLVDTFGKDRLNKNNVYANQDISKEMHNTKDVIFHKCTGCVTLHSKDSVITIADESDITIDVKENGYYTINVHDLSKVQINANDFSRIIIVSYGYNKIKYGERGSVKLIKKD